MVESKGWDWEQIGNTNPWSKPTEDGVYYACKWAWSGKKKVLDLGAGLGRHSIMFAKQGLEVTALEISDYAVNHLIEWAEKENVEVHAAVGDMMAGLPYPDEAFDCVFVYHAISHSDTAGVKGIVQDIKRVLKPGGELYTSICSKESADFINSGFPKIDENTLLYTSGPETNVPHYFADVDDILDLLQDFDVEKIRHTDYRYLNGHKQDSKFFYVNAYKK